MPTITDLDVLGIPSRDADRSRAFHRDALGLRPDAHAVVLRGDTPDTGVCRMAVLEDPDGNELMLHRRYAPYADAA